MEFTYPVFLYALSGIIIPILIHLFNLRKYQKVYFTNVRFLKEIQFQTKAKSKLKHLLVLISRILAITALVLAFSMPFIPSKLSSIQPVGQRELTSVYVDNSFSMEASGEENNLLIGAKSDVDEIITSIEPSTKLQILTNDFESVHQRLIGKEQLKEQLDDVSISPRVKSISAIINRQKDVLNEEKNARKSVFICSDFQKTTFDYKNITNDTSLRIHLVPQESITQSNLLIDSCWFSTPVRRFNENEILHVRVKNFSNTDYENVPVKLFINDEQKTPSTVTISAQSTKEIELSYTNRSYGFQIGKIVLRDYPVIFDDEFFFSYTVDSTIEILSINQKEENKALNALYENDDNLALTHQDVTAIDFGTFKKYHLIVLNELKAPSSGLIQEVKKFVSSGGSLVIFPSPQIDEEAYKQLSTAMGIATLQNWDTNKVAVTSLNINSDVFRNVFKKVPKNLNLPEIYRYYSLQQNKLSASEALFKLKNKEVLLEKSKINKGNVYLFAMPLGEEFSNFSKHSIFVPTLYNISILSQRQSPLFYTIGENEAIVVQKPSNAETIYHLTNEKNDIIPEVKINEDEHHLFFHNQIEKAGSYKLSKNSVPIIPVSFNYSREESNLESYTAEELEDIIKAEGYQNFSVLNKNNESLATLISFNKKGRPLWKYCLILALIFLGIEILLTKLWK